MRKKFLAAVNKTRKKKSILIGLLHMDEVRKPILSADCCGRCQLFTERPASEDRTCATQAPGTAVGKFASSFFFFCYFSLNKRRDSHQKWRETPRFRAMPTRGRCCDQLMLLSTCIPSGSSCFSLGLTEEFGHGCKKGSRGIFNKKYFFAFICIFFLIVSIQIHSNSFKKYTINQLTESLIFFQQEL